MNPSLIQTVNDREARTRAAVVGLLVLAALATTACFKRGPSYKEQDLAMGVAMGVALSPVQDVVVWTADADGAVSSAWIRGNGVDTDVIATRRSLVIPVGLELWQWRADEVEVPLCDCEAWEEVDREGLCPAAAEAGSALRVELVELISGERVELMPAPSGTGDDGGPIHIDFSAGAEPIASVGPYVFFRRHEGGTDCGAAHGSWSSEFAVVNLDTREEVEILAPAEREHVFVVEQQTAYELMRDDRLVEMDGPEDLELTVIEPAWQMGGLSLTYQFTADASYVDSDDNWGAYSRSVRVPAQAIPQALMIYAVIPKPLSTFTFPSGDQGRVGGYGMVLGTDEQIAALVETFSAGVEAR